MSVAHFEAKRAKSSMSVDSWTVFWHRVAISVRTEFNVSRVYDVYGRSAVKVRRLAFQTSGFVWGLVSSMSMLNVARFATPKRALFTSM